VAETTDVQRLDYGKPPSGYTICGDADEPQVRAGIALSSRDSGWVWLPGPDRGGQRRVIGVRSWEEALAAAWTHYKASHDPPGIVVIRVADDDRFAPDGDPPGRLVFGDEADGDVRKVAAWLLVEVCLERWHDGYKTTATARAAAWAWHDRRLGLVEKWQRVYDTDGDARQLAEVRYQGADAMVFDNWWPRCLTWSDEQVSAVERWLVDSTAEMPEVLRVASPAPVPSRNQSLLDALAETSGKAIGEGYEIDFGGACPVQGTGLVDGHEAYFRARGDGWSLEIYALGVSADDPKAEPIFDHHDAESGASWLAAEKSRAHIETAVALFREQNAAEVKSV
jgi:hypothetical protein